MKTRLLPFLLATTLCPALLVPGCSHETPTEPKVVDVKPQPTATPAPYASVAGSWVGTGDSDAVSAGDCGVGMPASATFTEAGSAISGTLTSDGACGFRNVRFEGTRDGNTIHLQVSGSASGDGPTAASGSIAGDRLELVVVFTGYPTNWFNIKLHLHR